MAANRIPRAAGRLRKGFIQLKMITNIEAIGIPFGIDIVTVPPTGNFDARDDAGDACHGRVSPVFSVHFCLSFKAALPGFLTL